MTPAMAIKIVANIADLKKAMAESQSTIVATTAAVQKLGAGLRGDRLIQQAHNITAAVKDIGGASKLTAAEKERLNATLTKAIEKYKALGQTAPPAMLQLAEATKKSVDPTVALQQRVEGLQESFRTVGSTLKTAGIGMTAAITAPLVAAGAAVVKFGMEAVESENLVSVSFGDMRAAADAWSKQLSANLGLNQFELRATAGNLFNMTTSMGLARDAAFKMSTGVAELAADMASFRNIPMAEALEKIRSGLTGEAEPLKRIGILVNDATIKTEAYRIGLAKQGDELTEVQKVQARWSAILRQTTNDQGDLARTMDSPSNQLRIMRARLEEAATSIGVALLPMIQQFVALLASAVPHVQRFAQRFADLPRPVQAGAVAIAAMAAAAGPLLIVLGSLSSSVASLLPLLMGTSGLAGAFTTAGGALGTFGGAIGAVAFTVTGLATALGGLAVAWTIFKARQIQSEADEMLAASETVKRAVVNLAEARAINRASAAGLKGEKLEGAVTLEMAAAWREAAAAAGKLAPSVGATNVVLGDFAARAAEANKGLSAAQKGIQAAAERTRQYQADLAKLGADGLATVRREVERGVGLKELAEDFDVNQDSLDRYMRSVKAAGELLRKEWAANLKASEEWSKRLAARAAFLEQVRANVRGFAADLAKTTPVITDVASAQNLVALAAKRMNAEWLKGRGIWNQLTESAEDVERHLKLSKTRLDEIVTAATAVRDVFGEIAATTSGEWRETANEIANIADAWGRAAAAAMAYGDAKNNTQRVLALAQGAGAVVQATGSGSTLSRTAGGALSGAAIGSVFGPWGTAIGAGVGAVTGLLRGLFGKSESRKQLEDANAQIKQLQQGLLKTFGSLENIKRLGPVGEQLAAAWGSQNVAGLEHFKGLMDQFTAISTEGLNGMVRAALTGGPQIAASFRPVIENLIRTGQLTEANKNLLLGLPEAGVPSFAQIEEAAKRYGIKVDELGGKVQQIRITEIANQAVKDWKLLEDAGADMTIVARGMKDEMQKLVTEALKYGHTLPEGLKPVLQKLVEMGLLTGDNKEKLQDLSGLKFEKPLSDSVDALILKLDELIETIRTGVGGALDDLGRKVVRPRVEVDVDGMPDGVEGGRRAGHTRGTPNLGFVDFGRATPTWLHGREAVVPESRVGDFAAQVASRLGVGGGEPPTVIVHVQVDPLTGQKLDERIQFVTRRNLALGRTPVPRSAVKTTVSG